MEQVRLTLVENAELFAPEPRGRCSILYVGNEILRVGQIDRAALLSSKLEIEVMDVRGNLVVPGLIDPHQHLLGGSGENGGFSSQTPEIALTEITRAGITTVVGTLGADTTMKTMAGLLAKVKGHREEGLSAYLYTGGYRVPPASILSGVREDIMFIEEVIGVGEVAIADSRSTEPVPMELARVVVEARLGGMLSNKAGIAHFHVGEGERRLRCLREMLEAAPEIEPAWLYPTHIERTRELIVEAADLVRRGAYADIDVAEGGLADAIEAFVDAGGPLTRLTISSDASKTAPANVLAQIRHCVREHRFDLATLLPLVTSNPARALGLRGKGKIEEGSDASFAVLDRGTLELRHLVSRGKTMVRDGQPTVREKFLQGSDREIHLVGERTGRGDDGPRPGRDKRKTFDQMTVEGP